MTVQLHAYTRSRIFLLFVTFFLLTDCLSTNSDSILLSHNVILGETAKIRTLVPIDVVRTAIVSTVQTYHFIRLIFSGRIFSIQLHNTPRPTPDEGRSSELYL